MGVPGVVSLSGGFPPAELFPLEGLTLTLRGGQTVTIDDPATVRFLRGAHASWLASYWGALGSSAGLS